MRQYNALGLTLTNIKDNEKSTELSVTYLNQKDLIEVNKIYNLDTRKLRTFVLSRKGLKSQMIALFNVVNNMLNSEDVYSEAIYVTNNFKMAYEAWRKVK